MLRQDMIFPNCIPVHVLSQRNPRHMNAMKTSETLGGDSCDVTGGKATFIAPFVYFSTAGCVL